MELPCPTTVALLGLPLHQHCSSTPSSALPCRRWLTVPCLPTHCCTSTHSTVVPSRRSTTHTTLQVNSSLLCIYTVCGSDFIFNRRYWSFLIRVRPYRISHGCGSCSEPSSPYQCQLRKLWKQVKPLLVLREYIALTVGTYINIRHFCKLCVPFACFWSQNFNNENSPYPVRCTSLRLRRNSLNQCCDFSDAYCSSMLK